MDIQKIEPLDSIAMQAAQKRWDSIAKPLGSLGKLETLVVRLAGICGTANVNIEKRCAVVFCADNGVVQEGVAQSDSAITRVVSDNLAQGRGTLNLFAEQNNCRCQVVDIGMEHPPLCEKVYPANLMRGTGNMVQEPAMLPEVVEKALKVGIALAGAMADQGYRLLCTGEMGIGNTTTSAAVASVLLGVAPEEVTGRGAGLSKEGIQHKVEVIRRAIALHQPNQNDPLDVLSKVGGLDLAGLAGVFLGGAIYRIPVVVDGFISAVGALVACHICPQVKDFVVGSHISAERGGKLVVQALGVDTYLDCGMCLGEGTGAVAALPLFDMAIKVYKEMSTFEDIEMEQYQPLT